MKCQICVLLRKKKKKFFLDYQFFFQEQKNFFQGTTFVQFFMYYNAKKNLERSENFWNFFFLKMLSKFSKKNFLDRSEIFFCIIIHKKLNKSCSLEKNFLFLKKKIVSLKKTLKKKYYWDPPWRISIQRDFDSLGGPLSPCGSHWLR